MAASPDYGFERYCARCGESLAPGAELCGRCGQLWRAVEHAEAIHSLIATLAESQKWRRAGLISGEAYRAISADLAARIERARPRPAVVPMTTADDVADRAPPAPRIDLVQWGSERQADILLYIGAFFLVVAAILFVNYQGEAFSAVLRLGVLGAYTVGFIVAGALIRSWERVREAGPVFIAIGAFMAPLNAVFLYSELLRDRDVPLDAIVFFGSLACTALYGALYVGGHGRLYRFPAGLALVSTWEAAFAIGGLPLEWIAAWNMAGAVVMVAIAWRSQRVTNAVVMLALVTATFALMTAHLAANDSVTHHAQLPATYALLTVLLVVLGVLRRTPAMLPIAAASTAATAIALEWLAGVPAVWWWYTVLLLGAFVVAASDTVMRIWPSIAFVLWPYAAICAIAPVLGRLQFIDTWHGSVTHLLGAGILGAIAWRNTRYGITLWKPRDDEAPVAEPRTPFGERVAFAWCAFLMLLAALAYAHETLGIARADTAWTFLGVATLLAGAMLVTTRRGSGLVATLTLPFLVAVATALQQPDDHAGINAIVLAVGAAELLACAWLARSWTLAAIAVALGACALTSAWYLQTWPRWLLALAFESIGAVLFVALTRWRTYRAASTDSEAVANTSINALSWGLTVAAYVPATIALLSVQEVAERFRAPGPAAVTTPEYRTLVGLVFATAAAIAYEGVRLRAAKAMFAASAVAMAGVLLAIRIAEPENIQAYTVPSAVYLFAVGLIAARRDRSLVGHLRPHELALVAGALVLVLPQAEQSFEAGGARWGFFLLLEGAAMLAGGLLLRERWLALAGVLTLSGVGVRWLAQSGDTIPYWLTLGVGGLLLLALGMAVLLARDWWDRVRRSLDRWWRGPLEETTAPSA